MAPDARKDPGFLARLQPRERTLVMALVFVFFAMTIGVLFYLRAGRLEKIEGDVVDLKTGLELVYTQGATFKEKQAAKDNKKSNVADKPLLFSTAIEKAEAKYELSTRNQELKPPQEIAPGLEKSTVEFDLRNVQLEPVMKFLAELEAIPGHVVVTENLLIRSSSNSEDRLQIDVTMATYHRSEPSEADK